MRRSSPKLPHAPNRMPRELRREQGDRAHRVAARGIGVSGFLPAAAEAAVRPRPETCCARWVLLSALRSHFSFVSAVAARRRERDGTSRWFARHSTMSRWRLRTAPAGPPAAGIVAVLSLSPRSSVANAAFASSTSLFVEPSDATISATPMTMPSRSSQMLTPKAHHDDLRAARGGMSQRRGRCARGWWRGVRLCLRDEAVRPWQKA